MNVEELQPRLGPKLKVEPPTPIRTPAAMMPARLTDDRFRRHEMPGVPLEQATFRGTLSREALANRTLPPPPPPRKTILDALADRAERDVVVIERFKRLKPIPTVNVREHPCFALAVNRAASKTTSGERRLADAMKKRLAQWLT